MELGICLFQAIFVSTILLYFYLHCWINSATPLAPLSPLPLLLLHMYLSSIFNCLQASSIDTAQRLTAPIAGVIEVGFKQKTPAFALIKQESLQDCLTMKRCVTFSNNFAKLQCNEEYGSLAPLQFCSVHQYVSFILTSAWGFQLLIQCSVWLRSSLPCTQSFTNDVEQWRRTYTSFAEYRETKCLKQTLNVNFKLFCIRAF